MLNARFKNMALARIELMLFDPIGSGMHPERIDVPARFIEWWKTYSKKLFRMEENQGIADIEDEADQLILYSERLIQRYPDVCERMSVTKDRIVDYLGNGVSMSAQPYTRLREILIKNESALILAVAATIAWKATRQDSLEQKRENQILGAFDKKQVNEMLKKIRGFNTQIHSLQNKLSNAEMQLQRSMGFDHGKNQVGIKIKQLTIEALKEEIANLIIGRESTTNELNTFMSARSE